MVVLVMGFDKKLYAFGGIDIRFNSYRGNTGISVGKVGVAIDG
jgi:hypothetical protein